MTDKAFQDYYPDNVAQCYGCGRLNEHGLQIKSYWEGDETVCHFRPDRITGHPRLRLRRADRVADRLPRDRHRGRRDVPGEGRAMDTEPPLRFVTASLHVDYLRPTPIDAVLELRGQVKELRGRKVIVAVTLAAPGEVCARGEVVCVRMPEEFGK